MKKLIIFAVVIFLLASCMTVPARDTSKLRMHMSETQVVELFGHPNDINRTVTHGVTSEQWVYRGWHSDIYLYFENHKLADWQD